jgi:hypothetical protein
MAIIQVFVDDKTHELLREISRRDPDGRSVAQLAEAAISDAAIRALPPHLRGENGKRHG